MKKLYNTNLPDKQFWIDLENNRGFHKEVIAVKADHFGKMVHEQNIETDKVKSDNFDDKIKKKLQENENKEMKWKEK